MLRILSLGLLSVLLAGSLVAAETGASARTDVVEDISQRLMDEDVIRGEFVQRRFLKILSRPLTSKGDFYYQKNLGARWRVTTPYPSTMYITHRGVSYPVEQRQPLAENFGQLLLALLTIDPKQLEDRFDVAAEAGEDQWSLTLVPRSRQWQQAIREILVRGNTAVESIEIFEVGGDRTVVAIDNVRYAPALNEQEKGELDDAVEQLTQ